MRRPQITTLPDGRRCYTEIVLRECESYEASLPDFLARIYGLLPTEADRASARITVTDAGIIVSRSRVESDVERSERQRADRDEKPSLIHAFWSPAAHAVPV